MAPVFGVPLTGGAALFAMASAVRYRGGEFGRDGHAVVRGDQSVAAGECDAGTGGRW